MFDIVGAAGFGTGGEATRGSLTTGGGGALLGIVGASGFGAGGEATRGSLTTGGGGALLGIVGASGFGAGGEATRGSLTTGGGGALVGIVGAAGFGAGVEATRGSVKNGGGGAATRGRVVWASLAVTFRMSSPTRRRPASTLCTRSSVSCRADSAAIMRDMSAPSVNSANSVARRSCTGAATPVGGTLRARSARVTAAKIAVAAKQVPARAWPSRVIKTRRTESEGNSSGDGAKPYLKTSRHMTRAPAALVKMTAVRAE
jgi:hypothetical protein